MQTMQQQLHAANAATLAAQQTAATAATNEAQATVKTAQEKVQPVTAKQTKPEIEPEILRQWKADEDYCRSYRKTQSKAVDEVSDDSEKADSPRGQASSRAPMPKRRPIKMEKICSMETSGGSLEFFARHVPNAKAAAKTQQVKDDDEKITEKKVVDLTPREPEGPPPRHLQSQRRCPPPKPHYGGEDGKLLVLTSIHTMLCCVTV